jgi:hypothetical protein
MTKATMRANARTLPEATSRRAILGAVLAAGAAAAALPAGATAAVARSRPDAELFALIERARTAGSLSDEANVAAEDIWERMAPSFPHALTWAETDAPHWHGVRPGQRIPDRDIDFLRDWLKRPERPDRPWPRDISVSPLIPLRAFVERAREIVRTKDEYKSSWQAAKEHPDVLGAEARLETLLERWRELALRVATTPAKTPEGLVAKIAFVAPAYVDDELNGTYDGILASATHDAQALVNARIGEVRT